MDQITELVLPTETEAVALLRGEALYRSGDYASAAELFAALIERMPEEAAPVRLLGLCALRLGDVPTSLGLLRIAHDRAPEDPWTMLHLGLGLRADGQHREAAGLFRAAAVRLPDDPAPRLNLIGALLALGEDAEALRVARHVRLHAPGNPHAQYMLGLACLARFHWARAAEAFAVSVRLVPNFADAWFNLGNARYRLGDMAGAIAATRQALAANPRHGAATANLAAFLRLTGWADAAETLLRAAIAHNQAAIEPRLNLAASLLHEEQSAAALALLDVPDPEDTRLRQHVLAQRALGQLQLRRIDEARATMAAIGPTPDSMRPLMLWRALLLANLDDDKARARELAAQIESLLESPADMLPEHRIMGNFDLAKFWSRVGEPDRAFPFWERGHRQLRQFQPFSRPAHRALLDDMMRQFNEARLLGGPIARNRDPAPVFIVGMPRSGTTLAEQILAAHPSVHGAGERPALAQCFARLGGGAAIAGMDAAALDHAATAYLAELHALAPSAARIIDRMPGNFPYLGLVGLMLPGARIIHCVRDPRDIGQSIFTHRFPGHHPYAHDLADIGWYIGEQNRIMSHWHAALPNPILSNPILSNPILTVALRNWVEDFDTTLRRVLEFLDLPYDPACERSDGQESRGRTLSRAQLRRQLNADGIGSWHRYERHLGPLIDELTAHGAIP